MSVCTVSSISYDDWSTEISLLKWLVWLEIGMNQCKILIQKAFNLRFLRELIFSGKYYFLLFVLLLSDFVIEIIIVSTTLLP